MRAALPFTVVLAIILALAAVGAMVADGRDDLFSSQATVDVSIKAPFDDLFAHAQRTPEYAVPATLTYSDERTGRDVVVDGIELTVRGRTSKRETECTFPKLKLRFKGDRSSGSLDSTVFAGMHAVKIGTHCGERADDDLTERFG